MSIVSNVAAIAKGMSITFKEMLQPTEGMRPLLQIWVRSWIS